MKTCNVCGKEKSLDQFYGCGNNSPYYQSLCKSCQHEYNLNKRRMARFGITSTEYRILVSQPCEICGEAKGRGPGKMVVDHSIAGNYHGVLCHACNVAIGYLRHNPDLCERAASYIRKTRGESDVHAS